MPLRLRPKRPDFSAFLIAFALLAAAGFAPAAGAGPNGHGQNDASAAAAPKAADDVMDLTGAVPLDQISKLPSAAEQAKSLQNRIAAEQPAVETAKALNDRLVQETESLKKKLVVTGAQVEALEAEKIRLDAAIADLTRQNDTLTAAFARDRVPATRLMAVLERLQSGLPPAIALKSDDVLAAAHGTMILGASLPQIYGRAAVLARRIEHIKTVRRAMVARRQEAERNGVRLTSARIAMNRLLARKQGQAAQSAAVFGTLKQKCDEASAEARNLDALLQRIAALRAKPALEGGGDVTSEGAGAPPRLFHPVAGSLAPGGPDGVGGAAAPGVSYTSIGGAQVLAPVDGVVRFAGSYPKNGYVLILETANRYDVVLAGLGRLDVSLGDRVMTGEPVGILPGGEARQPKLYFELRHDGRAMNPVPFTESGSRKAKRL